MIETNIHPPVIVKWSCFAAAMVTLLGCLFSSVTLINNYRTGEAVYRSNLQLIIKETITRESQPEKFAETQKVLAFTFLYDGILFLIFFSFFRKLGDW